MLPSFIPRVLSPLTGETSNFPDRVLILAYHRGGSDMGVRRCDLQIKIEPRRWMFPAVLLAVSLY
jgi:hypothetical protein